jgi:ketosteroid isomerase-like protein
MSRENVERVRRGYEALSRGELRPETFSAEFEVVEPSEQPGAETRYGSKGVRDSMTALSEAFEDFQFESEKFIDAGNSVVALLTARGRGKGSGIVVERPVAHVWTFRGDEPVRVQIYLDRAQAMRAVGVSEQGGNIDS